MKHRETINKDVEEKLNEDEWMATISYDGTQFLMRFPKDLAEFLKLKKKEKVLLKANLLKQNNREISLKVLHGNR
jgi:hypothetical protein